MSVISILKNLAVTFLLPPGNGLLLLCVAGIFRRHRWAIGMAAFATALLILQSLPLVSDELMASLERRAGLVLHDTDGAQAIVVLSGGLAQDAREYGGGDTVGERTLIRMRYGALLARRFGLPVLVSGGWAQGAANSEAALMADILDREFAVKVYWQETRSRTTAENAVMSAAILKEAGVSRIVLVTQAFHMPRAVRLFRSAGLEVIPAPTDFKTDDDVSIGVGSLIPRVSAMQNSYYALHEWLGIAWLALTVERTPAR